MQQITIETAAGVALVRFHNPPHGFMDGGTEEELAAVFDGIEHNDTLRARALTEMGDFVAGKRDIRDPEHMAGRSERAADD